MLVRSLLGNTYGSGNASGTVPASSGFIGQIFYIGTQKFTVTLANGALTTLVPVQEHLILQQELILLLEQPQQLPFIFLLALEQQHPIRRRARYSIFGSPLAVNAWYEENQQDSSDNLYAGAGVLDAATDEQIISAEFVKDRLIVYFERSTWELAYTGNEVKPFQWNKLNTELGSQSTFSTVPFDKDALTVGNTGIHACNGSNVQRIDNKIPDEIFEDFSSEPTSVIRTQGIRDYQKELVYWAFVTQEGQASGTITFPDQIMVYNYALGSWSFNDDCFTAFGYFEQQSDTTWESVFQQHGNHLMEIGYLVLAQPMLDRLLQELPKDLCLLLIRNHPETLHQHKLQR